MVTPFEMNAAGAPRADVPDPLEPLEPCDAGRGSTCPMVQLLGALAGKWAFPILYRLILLDDPVRFGVLQRHVGAITQKELTKHLRQFEALGLVTRTVYAEVPPRVEYRITEYGKTLRSPLAELARWSTTFGGALFEARERQASAACPSA